MTFDVSFNQKLALQIDFEEQTVALQTGFEEQTVALQANINDPTIELQADFGEQFVELDVDVEEKLEYTNISDERLEEAMNMYMEKYLTVSDEDNGNIIGVLDGHLKPIALDKTLNITNDGVLSVNTAESPEADNTLPITAAAVHTTVGNIEVLLATI